MQPDIASLLDTAHNLTRLGVMSVTNLRTSQKVYILDSKHLLIRNFDNGVNRFKDIFDDETVKGYFIIGDQPLSKTLRGYNPELMASEVFRKELFNEAKKKGKYLKYPSYGADDRPVPEFSSPTDIVLE